MSPEKVSTKKRKLTTTTLTNENKLTTKTDVDSSFVRSPSTKRQRQHEEEGVGGGRENFTVMEQENNNGDSYNKKISECFRKVSSSLYVSLAPIHLNDPIAGIKSQHLDPLVMNFFPEAGGVVLAHCNLELCGQDKKPTGESLANDDEEQKNHLAVAKVMYDSPFAFMWITVDFLIWKPSPGDLVEGWINMQSPSHIGLLIHDTFNASIKRDAIPRDWKFIPNQEDETAEIEDDTVEEEGEEQTAEGEEPSSSQNDEKTSTVLDKVNDIENENKSAFITPRSLGYWIDGNGLRVDGTINFTVKIFNVSGRTVSIQGSLLKPGAVKEDLTKPHHRGEDDVIEISEPAIVPVISRGKHVSFVDEALSTSNGSEDVDEENSD